MPPVPHELFKVNTHVPDTSYVGWNPDQAVYDRIDKWAFDSLTFYAYPELLPHPDGSGRKQNQWVMYICERQENTGMKRIIHVLPEFTDDGFVEGVTVYLGTEDQLMAPPGAIRELRIPERKFHQLGDEKPTPLYHCDFYGLLEERYEQDRHLRDLLPFDTTQFLVNIAYLISSTGAIYSPDVKKVKDVTEYARLSANRIMLQES